MPGRCGGVEVGWWLPLDHNNFHHRLYASWSREVLGTYSDPLFFRGFIEILIPKSAGFRVGL